MQIFALQVTKAHVFYPKGVKNIYCKDARVFIKLKYNRAQKELEPGTENREGIIATLIFCFILSLSLCPTLQHGHEWPHKCSVHIDFRFPNTF